MYVYTYTYTFSNEACWGRAHRQLIRRRYRRHFDFILKVSQIDGRYVIYVENKSQLVSILACHGHTSHRSGIRFFFNWQFPKCCSSLFAQNPRNSKKFQKCSKVTRFFVSYFCFYSHCSIITHFPTILTYGEWII